MKSVAKRIRRLELRLTPPATKILQITVTRIGGPDRIVELRLPSAASRVAYDR
jgi:hypothetical protein